MNAPLTKSPSRIGVVLWTSPDAYKAMQDVPNPYGDGMAAQRIADHMIGVLSTSRIG